MLIGTTDIPKSKLIKSMKSQEAFRQFSDSLVPAEFRHIKAILDNQCYVCCIVLRNIGSVSWDKKKPFLNEMMNGLRITGYADVLVEVASLLRMADMRRVRRYNDEYGISKGISETM